MTTVKDILDRKGLDVAVIDGSASVLEAARVMNTKRIGALVVMKGRQVVGIFTERDIMNRVAATQRSPADTTVDEVMTASVACCERSTSLAECNAIMTQKRIRHLPVVENGKVAGIVSSGDILAQEAAIKAQTIHYLNEYLYGPT